MRVLTFHPHPRVVLETSSSRSRRSSGGSSCSPTSASPRRPSSSSRSTSPSWSRRTSPRASSGRGGGRRRRRLPLRRRRAAISSCSNGWATRCGRCRSSRVSPRRRSGGHLHAGEVRGARLLGRAPSSTASSSAATSAAARSATRRRTSPSIRACSCPRTGSTPAPRSGHRAAVSIGTNPHYGGEERRIEPHLLDFDGDLYGRRLVVELCGAAPRRAGLPRRAGADRPDRPRRRGDAEGRATGVGRLEP